MQQGYFEWRQVSAADYGSFTLPAYLADILPATGRILDFGCGFGQMLKAISNTGRTNLVGVDIEPGALEECRRCGFTVFDGKESLDALDGTCELVVMSHVLEHFPKEKIIDTLKQVRRFLSPTGALVIMVPNAQSNTGCYWAYEDFTHHTLFTSGSLYYVLRAAGFASVQFLDIDAMDGTRPGFRRFIRKLFLHLYRTNHIFWNKITGSRTHRPSPLIFSYEIKAIAR